MSFARVLCSVFMEMSGTLQFHFVSLAHLRRRCLESCGPKIRHLRTFEPFWMILTIWFGCLRKGCVFELAFALPGFLILICFTCIWGCDQRSLGWACCACPGTAIDTRLRRHVGGMAAWRLQLRDRWKWRITPIANGENVWKCQVKRHRQEQKFVAKVRWTSDRVWFGVTHSYGLIQTCTI